MKKRLRKKLGVKEFYRPWFAIAAEIVPMADGDQAAFVSRFIAEAEKLDMNCQGAIGETDFEVVMDTGRILTGNAERRQLFVDTVSKWEEFVNMDVSELQ